jgi:hypothetical protein
MNLLETARETFTDDRLAALAVTLGESTSGTRDALQRVAVPAVLAGLLRQFGRDAVAGGRLGELLNDGGYGPLLSELDQLLAGGLATEALMRRGEGLEQLLFGGRSDAIADLIVRTAGLRPESARRLLRFVTPIVLAVLARSADPAEGAALAASLRDLSEPLAGSAPPELAAALGISAYEPLDLPPPRKPALWPWLLVPAVTLALFFTLRWIQQSSMTPPDTPAAASAPSVVRPAQ